MRIIFTLLLLGSIATAQLKVAGPSTFAGPLKAVPGGGTNNQVGPLDFFTDLSVGGINDAITAALLNSGTIGNGNTGQWAVSGTGTKIVASQSGCAPLGGSVTLGGVTYPIEHPSQAVSFDNTTTLNIITESTPSVGYNRGTVVFCHVVGATTFGGSNVMDVVRISGNGGHANVMQEDTTNCSGSLGINLETVTGTSQHTPCVLVTTGTTIWGTLLWDSITSTTVVPTVGSNCTATQCAVLTLYDTSFSQLGIMALGQQANEDISGVIFGNDQTGTSTGVNIFQNLGMIWSGGGAPTLSPKSTTQSPIYFISKVFNTTALSGAATTTVSPAINLAAGLTNVVWNSYENASGTTSGCTDTAGNTYTQATTVNLATQGHGEVWVAKNTIANPANIVTCTHTSSTFRNIFVVAVGGASLTAPVDVTATGTAASGNANVTSGSFTPGATTDSVIAFAYITAGVTMTAGTTAFLINTNSTTSVASEFRASSGTSSQTMNFIQANTSSKWMIAVALKQ